MCENYLLYYKLMGNSSSTGRYDVDQLGSDHIFEGQQCPTNQDPCYGPWCYSSSPDPQNAGYCTAIKGNCRGPGVDEKDCYHKNDDRYMIAGLYNTVSDKSECQNKCDSLSNCVGYDFNNDAVYNRHLCNVYGDNLPRGDGWQTRPTPEGGWPLIHGTNCDVPQVVCIAKQGVN